jgi:hypothetical protein
MQLIFIFDEINCSKFLSERIKTYMKRCSQNKTNKKPNLFNFDALQS